MLRALNGAEHDYSETPSGYHRNITSLLRSCFGSYYCFNGSNSSDFSLPAS